MRDLYPPLAPTRSWMLKVSDLHSLYVEESGNPEGTPVVFLHGGPGGGTDPKHRQFFDPAKYRIILFDQRGCGKSTPHAELTDNHTWALVQDIEIIRAECGIESWVVFGGSWGSTLALAYAETHPARVRALVLRGIFLCRPSELKWFYQEGTSQIFPDRWETYLGPVPAHERGDLMHAYYRLLVHEDLETRLSAARAWSTWEGSTSRLLPDESMIAHSGEDAFALALARIECHYFVNNCFFPTDNTLIEKVDAIRQIPVVIVQGRYDVVCPMRSAWDMHRAWPEAELRVIADAGHSAFEPGIISALVEATDKFA